MRLSRCLAAEALGTAFLLAVIVGSGIMGERLAGGNVAIALLANSIATGCSLWVLIAIFGPVSGAHFNPAVTLAMASAGHLPWRRVPPYVVVQIAAAFVGVALAHVMFALAPFTASEHVRSGTGQWVSEAVATAGLMLTIGLARHKGAVTVGGLVGGLYHGRLLVYRLNVVRQSGRDARACGHQYVCRDSSGRCAGLYRRAARGRPDCIARREMVERQVKGRIAQ